MLRRPIPLVALAGVIALAVAPTAAAHGLPGGDAESVRDFFSLGVRHMLAGWDHLLFILGIVLLAESAGRAAKLISLFVAGHSLTLLAASISGWQVSAALVDAVIAVSVAYIGLRIVRGRPDRWTWTGLVIFAFGLVHGLGLATRLQALDLPSGDALVARVLAFNVGVEVGQLIAVSLFVLLGLLARRYATNLHPVARPAGIALAAVGALAAVILGADAVRPADSPAASGPPVECTTGPPGVFFDDTTSRGHPSRAFYEPGSAAPPDGDLQHVMNDGYLIVRYRSTLPADQVAALASWADNAPRGIVVVPEPPAGTYHLYVMTRGRSLACEGIDLEQLSEFRDRWFQDVNAGRA